MPDGPGRYARPMASLLALARPAHWIKNGFVLAPLLFAGRLTDGPSLQAASLLALAFCLVSSGVYALNDVADRRRDARHPDKRSRPLPAGRLTVWQALAFGLIAAASGLALASRVDQLSVAGRALGAAPSTWAVAYLLLNLAYSGGLKTIPGPDVLCLALGVTLRLVAGAAALDLEPSRWLLLCGTLLALTLALGKRRAELSLLGEDADLARPGLARLGRRRLDAWLVAAASACLLAYTVYTLAPDTRDRLGSLALVLTVPPVALGLARFTRLARRRSSGDVVTLVLGDRVLLAAVLAWLVLALGVVHGLAGTG